MDRVMAKKNTANYVDRLLIKLDDAITPIWNSIFLSLSNLPAKELFFEVLSDLIKETPRLRSLWNKSQAYWEEVKLSEEQLVESFNFDPNPCDKMDRIHLILQSKVNLSQSLPIRVWIGKTTDDPDRWLLSFQLHHAAGDGRSIIFIVQRFWDLLDKKLHQYPLKYRSLAGPQMTDPKILKKIYSYKKSLVYLAQSKYRQLARRADALSHQAHQVGHPILQSCRFNLSNEKHLKRKGDELFYSALLAAVACSEDDGQDKVIRIRIPIDLRAFLSIKEPSVENACSAVVLELSLKTLKSIFHDQPHQLGLFMKKELKQALRQHRYLSNALECMLISRLSTAKTMQKAAKEEILAPKRSSSLVITHFGDVTKYIKPPTPIKLSEVLGHTPVWGGNSYIYEDTMYFNVTCFDGIWDKEMMKKFTRCGADWLRSHYGMEGELL